MSISSVDTVQKLRSAKAEWQSSIAKILEIRISDSISHSLFLQEIQETIRSAYSYFLVLEQDPELKHTPESELSALQEKWYFPLGLKPDSEGKIPYDTSFSNPDFAVQQSGTQMGQLQSALCSSFRSYRYLMLQERFLSLHQLNLLFLDLLDSALVAKADFESWLLRFQQKVHAEMQENLSFDYYWRFHPENTKIKDILLNADLDDLRYLYRYNIYFTEHEVAMAKYLQNYPPAELKAMAAYIVQSFVDGFTRAQKDYRIKKYAKLLYPCGMERLAKMVLKDLEAIGFEVLVPLPASSEVNKQLSYDHRFINAIYYTEEFVDASIDVYRQVVEDNAEYLGGQAGPIYIELFGEIPFNPLPKESALKLSETQTELMRKYSAATSQIYYQYSKRHESSFCIIAFPSPDIGNGFAEIFADTVKINLLDSQKYAKIQQNIIDVLDRADYVHVLGKSGNDTDIMVKMHTLNDPEHETNFENCVADVNIPVGEVFTSPVLKGSTGTLHVEDIYLEGLRYYNLKIRFEDGWVADYSCTNFTSAEENKKYIFENLLHPHSSLPIGEFAIGTNTTAYQIAKKHDILALLPILIIEKMGPHFAIGDTCYSHEEDSQNPSFFNGKLMVAVENEKSATRKDDPLNAYLQAHTDITLPYEMLHSIAAIHPDGSKTDIIRDGFFVVPGTEELNIPLQEMQK